MDILVHFEIVFFFEKPYFLNFEQFFEMYGPIKGLKIEIFEKNFF